MSIPHIEVVLPSGKYLLVKVPKYSDWFEMDSPLTDQIVYRYKGDDAETIKLPAGHTYTIIGKGNELTEDQWGKIVEADVFYDIDDMNTVDDPYVGDDCWKHYGELDIRYFTATESGHSLIRSKGQIPEEILILKID